MGMLMGLGAIAGYMNQKGSNGHVETARTCSAVSSQLTRPMPPGCCIPSSFAFHFLNNLISRQFQCISLLCILCTAYSINAIRMTTALFAYSRCFSPSCRLLMQYIGMDGFYFSLPSEFLVRTDAKCISSVYIFSKRCYARKRVLLDVCNMQARQ